MCVYAASHYIGTEDPLFFSGLFFLYFPEGSAWQRAERRESLSCLSILRSHALHTSGYAHPLDSFGLPFDLLRNGMHAEVYARKCVSAYVCVCVCLPKDEECWPQSVAGVNRLIDSRAECFEDSQIRPLSLCVCVHVHVAEGHERPHTGPGQPPGRQIALPCPLPLL